VTAIAASLTDRKKFYMLPSALLCWVGSFFFLARVAPAIEFIPQNSAVFLGATALTFLSALVVYGFSCLGLHRTAYLLTGVVAAVMVFKAATPLVNRSKAINLSGAIAGEMLFISAGISGLQTQPDKLLVEPRNRIFLAVSGETASAMPESASTIVLLCLLQLTLASGLGLWIGEGIDAVSHLIPVALVATLADIWSVSAGATSMIIVSSAINYFLLRFPVPGSSEIPYLIGLTDFLFFAIFFQAARRFALGTKKNVVLLLSSFLLTVAAALFFKVGLPVLPFMALFFVAGNFRKLELKKEETKQILVFVVVILTIFSAISFFGR